MINLHGRLRAVELYQLETFCRVARRLNFTRAAEELAMSQSAVSRHIEALEQEFGLELFVRSGRGVALTEAGVRLLDHAERVLHLVGQTGRAMAELRDLETGHLTVGASTTPGNYLLGPVVATYRQRYPGIDLQLRIHDSQAVERLTANGMVDLAVLAGPPTANGIATEPCLEDELWLLAAPEHPLSNRKEVGLADLSDTVLFVREAGSHTRQTVAQHFQARDFQPRHVHEIGSTEAIKQAVATGDGVAFLSRFAVMLEVRTGVLLPLPGPDCRVPRRFVLAYQKDGRRSPAALAFAALMRKMRPAVEARLTKLGRV